MNIFNSIGSFIHRLRSGVHRDPVRDWLALLTLSIIALILIVAWNVWMFNTVARGGVLGTSTLSTQPIFDRSSLDAIRTIFTDRAAEEAKYVTGVYKYTDPSQ